MGSKVDEGTLQRDSGLGWGKSLPVESVQELVRRDPQCVPERYIRDHNDRAKKEELDSLSGHIPIIDFSLLLSEDEDERKRLDLACKEWGFFQGRSGSDCIKHGKMMQHFHQTYHQIINHGISEEVLEKMKIAAAGFFELPLEQKKKYSMAPDDLQGYGQAYVVSEQQKLDWSDMIFLITQPPQTRKLNYWPTTVTGFMEAAEVYSSEVHRVGKELLANLSLMMNNDKGFLLELHGELTQAIRLNYYPACSRPDMVLGVSPHSDLNSISILLQDNEITGLQIRHNGGWVPVKPIPNALVVNIGDVIENWSNGIYKSIEHRAITNEKKARMSIATFLLPDPDTEIGPIDQMVDEHYRPRMYKRIKFVDYIRYALERKMEGKAHIQFLKLENE